MHGYNDGQPRDGIHLAAKSGERQAPERSEREPPEAGVWVERCVGHQNEQRHGQKKTQAEGRTTRVEERAEKHLPWPWLGLVSPRVCWIARRFLGMVDLQLNLVQRSVMI